MKFGTRALAAAAAALGALAGCAAQPAAVAGPPAVVTGADTDTTRILIKSVDDRPTLYVSPGALGHRITVDPGHHTIHVICDVQGSWVSKDVPIDAQSGQAYQIVGSTVSGPDKCDVKLAGHG